MASSDPEPRHAGADGVTLVSADGREWPTMIRALRHGNFRLFWFGQLISLIGTWMQSVAQGWLVADIMLYRHHVTDPSLYLGYVATVASLPAFVFTLFAGVLADRVNKRTVVLVTQILSMVQAFILAYLTWRDLADFWHVAVLAAFLGLVNAFDMPTRQAYIKDLVGLRDLANAIALNSSVFNSARVLGPAVTGLLITLGGSRTTMAFFVNGLSYLAVIAGLLAITVPGKPQVTTEGSVWMHLREGFRYTVGHRTIRVLLLIMAAYSVFGFSYIVLMPVFARNVLFVDARGYGALISIGGIGALIGALVMTTVRARKGRLLGISSLVFSLALIGFSQAHTFWWAAALLTGIGGGLVVANATINSIIQELVPDHLRGRVVSVYIFIFAGFTPLGALFIGTLAHYTSVSTALLVGGCLCLAAVLSLTLRAPWIWRQD
jgi:MFS family permease